MTAQENRPSDAEAAPEEFGGSEVQNTPGGHAPATEKLPLNQLIDLATSTLVASLDAAAPPAPQRVEADLLVASNALLMQANLDRPRVSQFTLLKQLRASQVAQLLIALHHVVRLFSAFTEENETPVASDEDPLVIWDRGRGVYVNSEDRIAASILAYNSGANPQYVKEVLGALRAVAPRVRVEASGRWAAVANGDLRLDTLELHPFDPERVFTARFASEWDPAAENPRFEDEFGGWDVDSGIREIANGDEGIERLLWEVLAATVNPQTRTNKIVGLYSPYGNNGKSTLVGQLRSLVGDASQLSASIGELAKESTLPLIQGKALIVSDENATNDFVKNAETIKKLATRDPILVNPKYKTPYNVVFYGTQVHNLNELPEFGDKSDSLWRRWLLIPLERSFEGSENRHIKDDYVKRPEVRSYILRRAMEMGFTGNFTETDKTRALIGQARVKNDPVRQFWGEFAERFAWDVVPLAFAYEVYKAWSLADRPSGRLVARADFDDRMRAAVCSDPRGWSAEEKGKQVRVGSRMSATEPLVIDYELPSKWAPSVSAALNPRYRDVLVRDRVGTALGSPAAGAGGDSGTPQGRLAAVEGLVAHDAALWELRAQVDHGVTDPTHVPAHAAIIRTGSGCKCPLGASDGRPQHAYPDSDYERAADLDRALAAAGEAVAQMADNNNDEMENDR